MGIQTITCQHYKKTPLHLAYPEQIFFGCSLKWLKIWTTKSKAFRSYTESNTSTPALLM